MQVVRRTTLGHICSQSRYIFVIAFFWLRVPNCLGEKDGSFHFSLSLFSNSFPNDLQPTLAILLCSLHFSNSVHPLSP